MSTSYDVKDYRTTHFEYQDLTKIHGKPDIDSLVTIFKEIKRNSQKVPSKLGGGRLGYLGLVLDAVTYGTIPNSAPFVRPVRPPPFAPSSPRLTQAEVLREKAAHDELVRIYNECNTIEDALKNQIIKAIPSVYLDPLRDADTDMIHSTIPQMITFLQRNYCKLTPEQVLARETTLQSMIHNPEDPVDVVFNKVSAFYNLCTIAGKTITDAQLVDYAYIIFNRCAVFADELIKWNAKDPADKTYDELKKHMRKAYHSLNEVGKLTIQDSSINMLNELKEHQEQLATTLTDKLATSVQHNLMAALEGLEMDKENLAPPPQANAVTNNQDLVTLIAQLQKKVDTLSSQLNATQTAGLDVNPKTGKPYKRYCFTCGCCNHWGRNHPGPKAPGHRDDATFKNRMGGSNKNCLGPK